MLRKTLELHLKLIGGRRFLRLLCMPAQIIKTMVFTQIMDIWRPGRSLEDHLNFQDMTFLWIWNVAVSFTKLPQLWTECFKRFLCFSSSLRWGSLRYCVLDICMRVALFSAESNQKPLEADGEWPGSCFLSSLTQTAQESFTWGTKKNTSLPRCWTEYHQNFLIVQPWL